MQDPETGELRLTGASRGGERTQENSDLTLVSEPLRFTTFQETFWRQENRRRKVYSKLRSECRVSVLLQSLARSARDQSGPTLYKHHQS